MSQGWICLHRKLLEWEWYDDIPTCRLFIHCLLKANHKDKNWKGSLIPRGSFITGRHVLSEETGLTERQIRTALTKLKSTNDLSIKATNKNSLVTIVNYEFYQNGDGETTNKKSNNEPIESPASDHNQQCNNEQQETNKRAKPVLFSQAVDLFNEICITLPEVKEKSEARRRKFAARWKENKERQDLGWWEQYFEYINQSEFLMGRTDANFKCHFDWIINETNMAKIIEGNYNR